MKQYVRKQGLIQAILYDGTNQDEVIEFAGDAVQLDDALGLIDPQTGLDISPGTVIYFEKAALIATPSADFLEDFDEVPEKLLLFGEALQSLKDGKVVTRKAWSGAVVSLKHVEGLESFLIITDKSGARTFTPGVDSLLASDWVETF